MFHVKHSVVEYDVPRETLENVRGLFEKHKSEFHQYATQLLQWNDKINLISREVDKNEVLKHIEHSLCIMYAPEWNYDGMEIIDAGSGGGLPGIPLAIVSDNKYQLIDVVLKKMMAVSQIIKSLKLKNVSAQQENLNASLMTENTVIISKHAFKIDEFLKLTTHKTYNRAIFLKGDDFWQDLEHCADQLNVQYISLEKYHSDDFFKGKYVVIFQNEKSGATTKTDSVTTNS
jgi:16S rRNA (guanine527-N7)-methyltransferase